MGTSVGWHGGAAKIDEAVRQKRVIMMINCCTEAEVVKKGRILVIPIEPCR